MKYFDTGLGRVTDCFNVENRSWAKSALLLSSLLFCTSCATSLDVRNTLDKKLKDQPVKGVVYALPMTQFDIEITRKVIGCKNDALAIKTDVKVEKKSIEDPAHIYAIDPTSLSHFFNKASSSITFYENSRSLKSFNATVEDETGAGITSVANIAGNILGAGLLPGARGEAPACITNSTATYLKSVETQIGTLERISANLETKNLDLARKISEQTENLPGNDPSLDASIAILKKQIKALLVQSSAEDVELKKALKPITAVTKITWPTFGTQMSYDTPIGIDRAALKNWTGTSPNQATLDRYSIGVRMERLVPAASHSGTYTHSSPGIAGAKGIYYRSPAKGRIVFSNCKSDGTNCYHEDMISQLGHVNVLPIETKPFGSATFSAEFSSDGGLTSAGYTETSSAASAFLAGASTVSSQYKTYMTEKSAAEQKELDAELKKLQTQASIIEAQAKLNPTPPSLGTQALSISNSQAAFANAEIARITAQRQLLALQSP